MTVHSIAVLPGDGIGLEVTPEACRVMIAAAEREDLRLEWAEYAIGGSAYETQGTTLPDATITGCLGSEAVLFGAVGGAVLDSLPREKRRSLLELRQLMKLYANLRPSVAWSALAAASPLRPDVLAGADIMFVRELSGGLYYGPRGHEVRGDAEVAWDTMIYSVPEVRRIARAAFRLARVRRRRLTSVDKANVLESSRLWRRTVTEVAREFPDVELEHLIVDNAALQLIRTPSRFDVVVAENTFGDILSDELGALAGSLGMLPSASLPETGPGLFEPVHGSAPDIAGKDIANPLGAILCAAMLLEYGLGQPRPAGRIRRAVEKVLAAGWRTPDLAAAGGTVVGTRRMGELVVQAIIAEP